MKIVIPMTGLGSRFRQAGYSDIKPLIKVDGRPIIEYVISMFPGEEDFLFIVNPDHVSSTPIIETLKRAKPTAEIVVEKIHERVGPVVHTLLAEHLISDSEPVIVCYCDFFLDWNYADFLRIVDENQCDAAVITYIGFHPHLLGTGLYGSLLVDDQNFMTDYREKYSFTANKMDCHQAAGIYYFKNGCDLKNYFTEVWEREESFQGEYYVSQAFPLMVRDGRNVYVHAVEHFCQWGEPGHLEEYSYWSRVFQKIAEEPRTFDYWKNFFHKMHMHSNDHHQAQD